MSLVIHPMLWKSKSINDVEEVLSILGYSNVELLEEQEARALNKSRGIKAVGKKGDVILVIDEQKVEDLMSHPLKYDFSKYSDFELAAFYVNTQIDSGGFAYFKDGRAIRSASYLFEDLWEVYGNPLPIETEIDPEAQLEPEDIEEMTNEMTSEKYQEFLRSVQVSGASTTLFKQLAGKPLHKFLDVKVRRFVEVWY